MREKVSHGDRGVLGYCVSLAGSALCPCFGSDAPPPCVCVFTMRNRSFHVPVKIQHTQYAC